MFWLLMIIPAAIGNYLVLHGLCIYLFAGRVRYSSRMRREARGFHMMMMGAVLVLLTTISTLITTI